MISPNTVPPFYPSNGIVAGPPTRDEYERRWAGLQATWPDSRAEIFT